MDANDRASVRIDNPYIKETQQLMMKFFKGRSLAVRLRMSSMTNTRVGVLTGLMAGLTISAQAQAQTPQNRLVITNVEVDYTQGQMTIHGRNFVTSTGIAPSVLLMEIGVLVKSYTPYTVVVDLPPVLQRAGSYLLTMSTGPNVEQNDSFDVTLGIQGPKGDPGPQGSTGPQGPPGPGAVIIYKDISALTALNSRCTPSELVSISCNRAIRDYCTQHGYLTGFGPTGYDSTSRNTGFVCLRK